MISKVNAEVASFFEVLFSNPSDQKITQARNTETAQGKASKDGVNNLAQQFCARSRAGLRPGEELITSKRPQKVSPIRACARLVLEVVTIKKDSEVKN